GAMSGTMTRFLMGFRRPQDILKLAVPTHYELQFENGRKNWQRLIDTATNSGVPITANSDLVMDRRPGPTEPDDVYAKRFQLAANNKVMILGYVDCKSGIKSIEDAKYEVRTWFRCYRPSKLRGIVFDNLPPQIEYTKELCSYARGQYNGCTIIVNV